MESIQNEPFWRGEMRLEWDKTTMPTINADLKLTKNEIAQKVFDKQNSGRAGKVLEGKSTDMKDMLNLCNYYHIDICQFMLLPDGSHPVMLSKEELNRLKKAATSETLDDEDKYEVIDAKKSDKDKYEGIDAKKCKEEIIDLLLENHNLILTGAPGTGKTYVAKQIAEEMNAETLFVQFHPSYDYTDFIEGLRPVKGGGVDSQEIGFKRKDGVFKEFCKNAINADMSNSSDNFEECWKILVDKLNKEEIIQIPLVSGKGAFDVEINENGDGLASRAYEDNSKNGELLHGKSMFFNHDQLYLVYKGLPGELTRAHNNCHRAIIEYMKKNLGLVNYSKNYTQLGPKKKYICIIDEINRGELSKIFGELFFSIDPGYRGIKGRVNTQYQNLVPEDDPFKDGFYIPENVYILGTMNDIDRSVESMDFAMRRRFTFKEIEADCNLAVSMLNDLGKHAEEAKLRMKNLNEIIAKTEGLGKAYQIGPAYFRKLINYGGNFEKLWKMNLETLLREYLRGFRNIEDVMSTFEKAYNTVPAGNK